MAGPTDPSVPLMVIPSQPALARVARRSQVPEHLRDPRIGHPQPSRGPSLPGEDGAREQANVPVPIKATALSRAMP